MKTETKSRDIVGGYVRIENNFEKALATLQYPVCSTSGIFYVSSNPRSSFVSVSGISMS